MNEYPLVEVFARDENYNWKHVYGSQNEVHNLLSSEKEISANDQIMFVTFNGPCIYNALTQSPLKMKDLLHFLK